MFVSLFKDQNQTTLETLCVVLFLFWIEVIGKHRLKGDGGWNWRAETHVDDGLPFCLRRIHGSTCDYWRYRRRRVLRPRRLMFSGRLPHWFPTSGTNLYFSLSLISIYFLILKDSYNLCLNWSMTYASKCLSLNLKLTTCFLRWSNLAVLIQIF